tara:strand:- start:16385 stop:16690 length:306 start_codon:yes stop_codon:yes gene_type:complete
MAEFREFIEAPPERIITDFDVLRSYFTGTKVSEISDFSNRSAGEIYRILKKHGVSPNRLRAKHQYVMNFSDAGMTIPQIAELTGYTQRNVRYILSGRHLND